MNKTQITAIVDEAINNAMNDYIQFLQEENMDTGLEANFQAWFTKFLDKRLDSTPAPGIFLVFRENKTLWKKINDNETTELKDYIDIAIRYKEGSDTLWYFIEQKLKRTDSNAPLTDAHILSYIDIYKLENHVDYGDCEKAYFMFLTDAEGYKKGPTKSGTRTELPMQHGSKIDAGVWYKPSLPQADEWVSKTICKDGFIFRNGHVIDYKNFKVDVDTGNKITPKDYWYFIINID